MTYRVFLQWVTTQFKFYIHGSVHRESNLITVQQDATVISLLYFCRQLYMFRVLTLIIRTSYNCNYSFWYWLIGSTTIRSRWVPTQQPFHRNPTTDSVDWIHHPYQNQRKVNVDKQFTFLPRNTELRRWNNLLHASEVNHRHRSPSSLLESNAANTMKWAPKRSYFYYLQREPQKNFIQKEAFMKLSYVILGATGIQNQNSYLNRL